MTTIRDTLRRAIRDRRDDLTALTQDLIRIPTVNPPGDGYFDICAFVREPVEVAAA